MQGNTKPISREASSQAGKSPLERWLGGSTDSLAMAGAELGFWNFLASSLQVRAAPLSGRLLTNKACWKGHAD